MILFNRKPSEPVVYALCPNVECKSDLSATVRPVESVSVGALPVPKQRGTLRVCIECGEMYVVAAGRVFRYHASNRPQRADIPGGPPRNGTLPQAPARMPNLSEFEP